MKCVNFLQGGVKFEINLDVCVPEEDSIPEAEVCCSYIQSIYISYLKP